MDGLRLIVRKEGKEAMAALAGLRDPQAALLYAYAASRDGGCTEEEAAAALGLAPEQVHKAAELTVVYGLTARELTPPPRQEPAYSAGELVRAREGDPAFSGLCSYFESAAGRILNRREMETLLNVHESLGMKPDVLTLLIGDCARRGRLTAREVERVAYRWHDMGLTDYADAEAYLQQQRDRRSRGARVLALFGMRDRLPGESEQKYIDKWDKLGMSDALLKLAYDRTLLGAGRMSWPYLDKIVTAWHEKGITTPEQAEHETREGPKGALSEKKAESAETAILRKMQEKRQQRALTLEKRREELRRESRAFAENESAMRLCASRMARSTGDARAALEAKYRESLAIQREILEKLGKPADYLTDKPDCAKCGDRGYVGTKKCDCLLRELKKLAGA